LVGTARGFRRFPLADPRLFRGLPAHRGREISQIVLELRKSG
jgi:hypothetical protein